MVMTLRNDVIVVTMASHNVLVGWFPLDILKNFVFKKAHPSPGRFKTFWLDTKKRS